MILANAGPFDHLSDESFSWLDEYLAIVTTREGVTRSRANWFKSDEYLKQSFLRRLALFGHFALQAAIDRHEECVKRGEKVRDLLALELSDMLKAEPKVAKLSGTVFCTPDIPDD